MQTSVGWLQQGAMELSNKIASFRWTRENACMTDSERLPVVKSCKHFVEKYPMA
jgi:hypothetical protein